MALGRTRRCVTALATIRPDRHPRPLHKRTCKLWLRPLTLCAALQDTLTMTRQHLSRLTTCGVPAGRPNAAASPSAAPIGGQVAAHWAALAAVHSRALAAAPLTASLAHRLNCAACDLQRKGFLAVCDKRITHMTFVLVRINLPLT